VGVREVHRERGREDRLPGTSGSCLKLYYTELKQRVGELSMRVLGRAGARARGRRGPALGRVRVPGAPVALDDDRAGSSQIQRNIISERILGLPKERR
jgi:alkylation response protein AidB-like acyl-CoA dehydrogenase